MWNNSTNINNSKDIQAVTELCFTVDKCICPQQLLQLFITEEGWHRTSLQHTDACNQTNCVCFHAETFP